MKILRLILIVGGLVLLVLGLYSRFVLDGPIVVNGEPWSSVEGYRNQATGMMGIGVLAMLAGWLAKSRR